MIKFTNLEALFLSLVWHCLELSLPASQDKSVCDQVMRGRFALGRDEDYILPRFVLRGGYKVICFPLSIALANGNGVRPAKGKTSFRVAGGELWLSIFNHASH